MHATKKKGWKRFLRRLGLGFVILLLSVILLLQTNAVQDLLGRQAAHWLSKQWGHPVRIEHLHLSFFDGVFLQGLYVEDQGQDTLLYVDELEVRPLGFSIAGKWINLEQIRLQGVNWEWERARGDSLFNLDYFLQSFSSESADTTTTEPASPAWKISLDELNLQEVRIRREDAQTGTSLSLDLGKSAVRQLDLDLENQSVQIARWTLSSTRAAYVLDSIRRSVSTPEPSPQQPLQFPYTGWTIQLDQLLLWKNQLVYHDWKSRPTNSRLDLKHMNWSLDSLDLSSFDWNAHSLETHLQHLQMYEANGYALQNAHFKLGLHHQEILLEEFSINTPGSQVQNTTRLRFSGWDILSEQPEKIESQVDFPASHLQWADIHPFLPTALQEQFDMAGPDQIRWEGQLRGSLVQAEIPRFFLQLGQAMELDITGNASGLTKPDEVAGNLKIHQFWTQPEKLAAMLPAQQLPTGSNSLGKVMLTGNVSGSLNELRGDSLHLSTEAGTRLVTYLEMKNILDTTLAFRADIQELYIRPEHLQPFLEDSLPAEAYRLEFVQYAGQLQGDLLKQELSGEIRTSAGSLNPNLSIQFEPGYTTASYQGVVEMTGLHMGVILDSDEYGPLNGILTVSGRGMNPDSLEVTGEGTLDRFVTSQYTYQDLGFSGSWDAGVGSLKADMKDPHLQFRLQGNADLTPTTPVFSLNMEVDTLDAGAMQWRDRSLAGSARLDASWQGLVLDSMLGSLAIHQLHLSSDSLHFFNPELTVSVAAETDTGKTLQIRSPFLWVDLNGNYHYRDLPDQLYDQVAVHLPILPDTAFLARDTLVSREKQAWDLQVKVRDILPLLAIWDPSWKRMDSLELNAVVERSNRKMEVDLLIPNIAYEPMEIGRLQWSLREEKNTLRSTLHIDSVTVQDSFLYALDWQAIAREDTVFSDLRIGDYESADPLNTSGRLTKENEWWKYELLPPFALNGKSWDVQTPNAIWLGPESYFIDQIALERNQRQFTLQSDTSQNYPRHQLELQHFALRELNEISGWYTYQLGGDASGQFTWVAKEPSPYFTAAMNVQGLALDQIELGTLKVSAEQAASEPRLLVDISLDGQRNEMNLQGTYELNEQMLDLQFEADQLEMEVVDLFAEGEIRESRGALTGKTTIQGSLQEPTVQGYLGFRDMSTFVDFMQTRYAFGNDTVFFDNEEIRFSKLRFRDPENRTATLEGEVLHQGFRNFEFDARLFTDRFQFLNTRAEDNDLFYGNLMLRMDLLLRGTLERPQLKIDASTLAPTNLVMISPADDAPTVEEGGFIIYGNPTRPDSMQEVKQTYELNKSGFEMLMQLALTPEAQFKIVIDPVTGDYLTCRGRADITTKVDPEGSVSVLGTYTLEDGTYSLNYENVFKRKFNLKEGSTITFVGDPMDSRFDITAIYRTKTTYLDLLQNEMTLSEVEMRAARKRQEVEVVMRVQGDLERPELHFDIQLPESEQGSPLAGAIERKLAQLREKETDLNSQVFGILLFNGFISTRSSSSSFSIGGTTEAIALSSLSKLITNQLNRLAGQFLGGVDLSVGVDSYKAQTDVADNTVTEVELGLSKKAFNDRLTIEVGGNLDLSSEEGNAQLADFTTVAGDFILDYQLDPQGRYHIQVFQKSQYDLINESNSYKTGVGFSLQKKFNSKRKKHEASNSE